MPNTAHVLVAEDSALNRKLVGSILEKLGCQVDMAADGNEAVQAVAARPYAMVLMDCQMPVMDGFEAARAIRQKEKAGRLPIIALTGTDSEGERQKCLDAGMDDFLTKPITLDGLRVAIERWVPASAGGA
ncbi:MAG TPA: response regulator [Oscillatoriaceae cyanobacterium]